MFHTFLRHRLNDPSNFIRYEQYVLYRQWPGLKDDPWQVSWQAGEVVSMSALYHPCEGYEGGHYCLRCGRYDVQKCVDNQGVREGAER